MKQWFVRDSEGYDFRCGYWKDGVYHCYGQAGAQRELELLDEPGSYIWSLSVTEVAPPNNR